MATKTGNDKKQIKGEQPSLTSGLQNIAQAALLELPAAAFKRLLGGDNDREMYEAAWKAYDSTIGLTNDATNRLYTNETVGAIAGRTMEAIVGWQRFNNAVAGAFFAALWPAVGLPTATEVEGVRADIKTLREELREAVAERDSSKAFARELRDVVRDSVGRNRPSERKSNDYQISQWWTSNDSMGASEDVGN
jgi:hypothetical protein